MANIEHLKHQTDEIKKGLDNLRNNTISESERKLKANELKSKADIVKRNIQSEIDNLKNKTKDKSKKEVDEAEALLTSFDEMIKLHSSIINLGENLNKEKGKDGKNDNVSGSKKEGIGNQGGDMLNRAKKHENIKNITSFISEFDFKKFTDRNSIYNDSDARDIVLILLESAGFNKINNETDFEEAINNFLENKLAKKIFGNIIKDILNKKNIKGIHLILRTLADNYYRGKLNSLLPICYDESTKRRKDGTKDKSASMKESVFACIEGLVTIGTLDEKDLMNYQFIKNDLNDLGFKNLDELKNYNNSDTIKALEYVKEYGEQAKQSSQSDGIKTEDIDGYVYAPGAYSKMLMKEYKYFKLAESSRGVLSLEDYNELFCNFNKFRQTNIGDCYLISVIRGLARTQYFDTLMRTSIKKDGDGGYIVKLPLGETKGTEVHVTKSELENAKAAGSDGYKLIEVAFAHFCENRAIKSKEELDVISGGYEINSMKILLGREGYNVENYKIPKDKDVILKELKDFNPESGDIISFGRPSRMGKDDVLPTGHAMIVTKVEKDKDGNVAGVQVENPWNNPAGGDYKTQKYLTINEFLDFADDVTCGSITDDFMNLETSDYLHAQQSLDKSKYNYGRLKENRNHTKEARNRWNLNPSWEGFKNIPEATSDVLNPVGSRLYRLGRGTGYAIQSGGQYAREGVKDAGEWVGDRANDAREGSKKTINNAAKWIGKKLGI